MIRQNQALRRSGGRQRRGALLALLLLADRPPAVAAQCPDGTPPPCAARAPARGAARPAAPMIDRNRIAVLPFRVTTADTMLGEGVAELLSAEFTGESGPRAVHMGTVLRAWRGAGGRAGAPLPPEDAVRAGRAMGAGLVVDGSVVGIGQRLTISASVMSVPEGRARRATPISGSADSLEVLLRRFSTSLLAVAGGEPRAVERGTLTDSPSAMRAYLVGLSYWRRYRIADAARAFERAFAEDSTFARAAFMRFVTTQWGNPSSRNWARTTWNIRDRLLPADRILLTAYLGENYPPLRPPAQILADRQRAANLLPESPEAQYVLGDWLFHHGAAANVASRAEQSVALFRRSLALDTQETVLAHLVEAAAMVRDTATLRELKPALDRANRSLWAASWLAAALLRDGTWLAALRLSVQPANSFAIALLTMVGVPDSLVDEAIDLAERASPSAQGQALQLRYFAAIQRGRPEEAERLAAHQPATDLAAAVGRISAALYAEGDTAGGRLAVAQLGGARTGLPHCLAALWSLEQGERAVWSDSVLRRSGQISCAAIVAMEQARRSGAPDAAARLLEADSVVRFYLGVANYAGFENLVLARAFEARGDVRRALNAIRLRPHGLGVVWTEAVGAREEGRLAALVGDTAGAIRAYRHYLELRHSPEPDLIAQRDSVRAELARLERR
jgi:TolB-like protein